MNAAEIDVDVDTIKIDALDDSWIVEFNDTDKLYSDFYKDNVYYINVTIIYINDEHEIERMKKDTFLLSRPNELIYEELIRILKDNATNNNKKYGLMSILKYNFDIEPMDMRFYLQHNNNQHGKEEEDNDEYNYLFPIQHINNIVFQKTISMFQDLNELVILFYEKPQPSKRHTQSVKHHLSKSCNKTVKKRYKE